MLKFGPDGKWYIFAMQAGFNDSNTYTFTLPPNFTTASTATVLNETRTVPISAGAFSDNFGRVQLSHLSGDAMMLLLWYPLGFPCAMTTPLQLIGGTIGMLVDLLFRPKKGR
jgi:hypothetical protein